LEEAFFLVGDELVVKNKESSNDNRYLLIRNIEMNLITDLHLLRFSLFLLTNLFLFKLFCLPILCDKLVEDEVQHVFY